MSIDCGVLMNGYYGDHAYTFAGGEISEDRKKLIEVTKNSLYRGIYSCRIGNRTGDIGYAIQNYAEKYGYGVVREFVGHGLGKNLHENPRLPNYGKRGYGKKLLEGMVLAIEPMINQGTPQIIKKDDWTIITADNKPSVHFEHNVAIVNGNPILLSTYKFIYQTLNIHSDEEEPFIIKDY